MTSSKDRATESKSSMHPRNKNNGLYDFNALCMANPSLKDFVSINKYGNETVDFANPKAVMELNRGLLMDNYGIQNWEIPDGYLCPPIPGRADYLHHIADLLADSYREDIPKGSGVKILDIGTGANCIYPIIGIAEYGWSFVCTDIDEKAIRSGTKIRDANPLLKDSMKLILQKNPKHIFKGVLNKGEHYDVSMSNPPFHASEAEANAANLRKLSNLQGKKVKVPVSNFGGKNKELWCEGGERVFIQNMIRESRIFADVCCWYTTLVSKQSNLRFVQSELSKNRAVETRIIEMGTGNKKSRIVAWTFMNQSQQKLWMNSKWKER